ncbi:CS1 fimbrial subunit B flags: Precursor [Stenotrophomonas sp. PSU-St83]
MKRLILLGAALLLPTFASAEMPSIHVGAMYEYLLPDQGALLKRVRNSGDATAFVRVQVTEVRYTEDNTPYEVDVEPGVYGGGGNALIASPSRLIVPRQGQQATRLLFHGNRDKERYYRVRFVPVLPKKEDEFALTEAQSEDYRRSIAAGVNVLTGYGVFVIVHPEAPSSDLRTDRQADRTVVHNAGNSTVVLDNVRQCSTGRQPGQCGASRRVHLLPGRSEAFAHLPGQDHRFEIVEGKSRKSVLLD